MRKALSIILVMLMLVFVTGCGSNDVEDKTPTESDTEQQNDNEIDVDLTTLSSTMVYAEVYSMFQHPDEYVGKTVKMSGIFATYEHPETGEMYFATIIADATACCSQGIEFTLKGDYSYPEDYPEPGKEISVVGEFEHYEEDGFLYCRLKDATML